MQLVGIAASLLVIWVTFVSQKERFVGQDGKAIEANVSVVDADFSPVSRFGKGGDRA